MDTLELIRKHFGFLVDSFNYQDILDKDYLTLNKVVVIYRNENSQKQIEVFANNNIDGCMIIIRKLINNIPVGYDNKDFCIDIDTLAILDSNNYINPDYFPSGNKSKVLSKSAELLKKNEKLISTSDWIDIDTVDKVINDYWINKFGRKYDRYSKSVLRIVFDKLYDTFNPIKILYFSELEAPYNQTSKHLPLEVEINGLTIKAGFIGDWREQSPYKLFIDIVGHKTYTIDNIKDCLESSLIEIIKEIKVLLPTRG